MRFLFDVRVLSRGSASGIEEYTRNILTNILQINKQHNISLFYNGLRKQKLNYPGVQIIDHLIPN
ncbi:MAG: hypothetical protein Q8Q37_02560, partial [bacterium]|nr:hypothetical protein [bacterium]